MSADSPNESRDLTNRLDRAVPPYSDRLGAAGDDPLVEAAQQLASGPDVALSAAALDRIEARLRARTVELAPRMQAQAASNLSPVPPAETVRALPRRRSSMRLLRYAVAACLVIALVLTSAGAARASDDSVPGDVLYPLKRLIEQVRLSLVSTENEPDLRLELAERRLDEFETLLEHNKVDLNVLEDASTHLDRAMQLADEGHGNPVLISQQAAALAQQKYTLIQQAMVMVEAETQQQLNDWVAETTAETVENVPATVEDETVITLSPLATFTATPTLEPSATASLTTTPTASPTGTPSRTPTPTLTATPLPTFTAYPSATLKPVVVPTTIPQIQPTAIPDTGPTRTPPGHGEDPGLGDNPPGQGGDNPGVGNDGNPPGQENKPEKAKKDK